MCIRDRFGAERNNFIKYLTKNKRVDFRYENEAYHIEIDDVAVFPQCYAAVAVSYTHLDVYKRQAYQYLLQYPYE